jgi:hypothetical protein
MKKNIVTFFIIVLIFLTFGCSKNVTAPEEIFPVQGILNVSTIDESGNPISVPVKFKTLKYFDEENIVGSLVEENILYSNELGRVTYESENKLKANEYFVVTVDVSNDEYESINYWTAYFKPVDSPQKVFDISLIIIEK